MFANFHFNMDFATFLLESWHQFVKFYAHKIFPFWLFAKFMHAKCKIFAPFCRFAKASVSDNFCIKSNVHKAWFPLATCTDF